MVYACDACRFLFESNKKPERCPDCGKLDIRQATREENEEYESRSEDTDILSM